MKERWIVFCIVFILLFPFVVSSDSCWDPVKGHCYPRRGIFLFHYAPTDWLANFDLVITAHASDSAIIKQINPHAFVLRSGGLDWNAEAYKKGMSTEWNVKDSSGKDVQLGGAYGKKVQSDISNFCPVVGGKRYNEWLAELTLDYIDLQKYDGFTTQGVWDRPRGGALTDVDLDRNCPVNGGNGNPATCNDWVEHDRAWITNKWLEGVDVTVKNVRAGIGDNKLLILNSGRFHDFNWEDANGLFLEHFNCFASFKFLKGQYNGWMAAAPQPHVLLVGANRAKSKEDFSFMRFILGITMYGDGYYEFTDKKSGEHYYIHYYDEYDLNLGWPKTSMKMIGNKLGSTDEGIYVRFFDNGAVIVNVDDAPHSVSDSDIRSIDGYGGPYYRFLGGQDTDFNNGQPFSTVALKGRRDSKKCFVGDAIILTKIPTTSVSDIVVDNDHSDTSPASEPAVFTGNWVDPASVNKYCDNIVSRAWGQLCRNYANSYSMIYSSSAGAKAIFTPTIGIAGDYEIFEWHGSIADKKSATAVRHVIYQANGQTTKTVDQSKNVGRWNSLGTYSFDKGISNKVTIFSDGASGVVIADAIKFVFKNNQGNIKGESNPPASCSELGGTPCQSDEECDGGSFSYSSDYGSSCCVGGTCNVPDVLLGDLNSDGIVNIIDLVIMIRAFGTSQYDLTGDGNVDVKDLLVIVKKL